MYLVCGLLMKSDQDVFVGRLAVSESGFGHRYHYFVVCRASPIARLDRHARVNVILNLLCFVISKQRIFIVSIACFLLRVIASLGVPFLTIFDVRAIADVVGVS